MVFNLKLLLKMITICSVSLLIACSKDVVVYQEHNSKGLNMKSRNLVSLDLYIESVKKHRANRQSSDRYFT